MDDRARAWADWFGGNTAYVDPNDWGPEGYGLLTLLLLTFQRVAVHSPREALIRQARLSAPTAAQWRDLILSWADLEDLAVGDSPPLIVTAHESYRDRHYDGRFQDDLPASGRTDFGRFDRAHPYYQSVRLVGDFRKVRAELAIEMAGTRSLLEQASSALNHELHGRYRDIISAGHPPPEVMASRWASLTPPERYASLILYDFWNDEAAVAAAQATVRCPTPASLAAARFLGREAPVLPGLGPAHLTISEVAELLELVSREVSAARDVPIDAGLVRRVRHERGWLLDELGAMLATAEDAPSEIERRNIAVEWTLGILKTEPGWLVRYFVGLLSEFSGLVPHAGSFIRPAFDSVLMPLREVLALSSLRREDRWKFLVQAPSVYGYGRDKSRG